MDEVGNTRWRIELPLPGMLGVPEEPDSVQSVISACSDPSATAQAATKISLNLVFISINVCKNKFFFGNTGPLSWGEGAALFPAN